VTDTWLNLDGGPQVRSELAWLYAWAKRFGSDTVQLEVGGGCAWSVGFALAVDHADISTELTESTWKPKPKNV
jgi:hypothetical protein